MYRGLRPRRPSLRSPSPAGDRQDQSGKVYFGARGRNNGEWMMKREQLSPRCTTMITELPVVR
ncbi:DUF4113 domain-containing protein [Aeromonas popoffii]|uniref:DUF4113 domain-containing protein n=1 Tax=Aeromonas popoffii TaxID=70856 RepID=UPI003BB180AD